MYFLVSLKTETKTTIIVPLKWIYSLDIIKLLNYGVLVQKKIDVLVYFGTNLKDEPDFNCKVLEIFDLNRSACYRATIIRGFGKYSVTNSKAHCI